MLIKDQWYIACPSSKLSMKAPRATQIGDLACVAFRDADAHAHVLLDRCCHRGVKLSLGRLTNGCIACGYHGWQYSGDGKLKFVPSLGAESTLPSYSVPSFPVTEKYQYVWVWIAGEFAQPTHEPILRGVESGNWIQQTVLWKTNVMPAVENQLDVAHTAFAHPGIYPGHNSAAGEIPPLSKSEYVCEVDEGSVLLGWHSLDEPAPAELPTPENPAQGFALFELPYKNYVFLEGENIRAIYNWVPLTNNTCRLEFLSYTGSADHALNITFLEGELELLSQDRILLESAQDWFDQGAAHYEKNVRSDGAPLAARKLVKDVLEGKKIQRSRRSYSSYA